jgi:hypothetical protein
MKNTQEYIIQRLKECKSRLDENYLDSKDDYGDFMIDLVRISTLIRCSEILSSFEILNNKKSDDIEFLKEHLINDVEINIKQLMTNENYQEKFERFSFLNAVATELLTINK